MSKSNRAIQEEQRYARHEILICADAIIAREPDEQAAMFAAAVREYLHHAELELEGRAVNPTDDKRARLVLADVVEKEFAKCTHAPAETVRALWCDQCGAGRAAIAGAWRRPNWRATILRALLAAVLLLVVGCGGSTLDVGSTAGDAAPCLPGWADCDGDPRNGCESSLSTDLHCGYCSRSCVNSACTGAWPAVGCSSVGNRVDAGGSRADGG
jgi:hypothetical protein